MTRNQKYQHDFEKYKLVIAARNFHYENFNKYNVIQTTNKKGRHMGLRPMMDKTLIINHVCK